MRLSGYYLPQGFELHSRWVRPQLFSIVLTIFLLEQVINAYLGVALSVPIVLFLMLVLRSSSLFAKGIPIGTPSAIAVIVLIMFFQLPSVLFSPDECTINAKFVTTTLTFLISVWAMWLLRPELSIFSNIGSRLLLYWIIGSVILAQIGLDIVTILGTESRSPSGFYFEPSHLALHLVPLVAYRLLRNFSDRLSWISLTLVSFFAPSTTLAAAMFILIIIKLGMIVRSKWFVAAVLLIGLVVITVLSSNISTNPTLTRVSGILNFSTEEITSLSSSVWLNGWSQMFDHLVASNGWGVGINRMGCGKLNMAGYLTPLISEGRDSVLNATDGSFLFAKVVAEFGFLGLLACIYLSYLAVNSLLELSRHVVPVPNATDMQYYSICRAASGLTLLIFLYVRGISYFAFPLMLSITTLLRSPLQIRRTTVPLSP